MDFDLERFVTAQRDSYSQALGEIRRGRKHGHWMWYIFPQIAGLGRSDMAKRYSIRSVAEAQAYLSHPVLGRRLLECVTALLDLETWDAQAVFGFVDAMKLRSSLTLFALAAPDQRLIASALDRWFKGERDNQTIQLAKDI